MRVTPTRRVRGRALGALALAAVLMLGACDRLRGGDGAPGFVGIDITGAPYARTLSLPDPSGRTRTLAEFKGKALVVFFGYVQCPDVCPTVLADVAQARRLLGPLGERVQPIFVTVDPQRDTPEVLAAYAAQFGADVLALAGSEEAIRAAAQEFKVVFNRVPGKTAGSYTVDHTAGAYVFDPQGRVRLFVRYGAGPQALADDLKVLLTATR